MTVASDLVFAPKPCARVRLDEHVDFVWCQRKSPQMKIGEGLNGIDDEPNSSGGHLWSPLLLRARKQVVRPCAAHGPPFRDPPSAPFGKPLKIQCIEKH